MKNEKSEDFDCINSPTEKYDDFFMDWKAREQKLKAEKESFYAAIGALLRKHRLHKGMAQAAVARDAGISAKEWQAVESGRKRISLFAFMRACRMLEIDFKFTHRFALNAEELDFLKAFRQRDYKQLLMLLAAEI